MTDARARALQSLLVVVAGLVATAIGLLSLWNPVVARAAGLPHWSDAPPVWGVGMLVVPIALLGRAAYDAWWTAEIDLAARRERRRWRGR